MRAFLALVVLVLLGALAFFLRATNKPDPEPTGTTVERDGAGERPLDPATGPGPQDPGRTPVTAETPQARPTPAPKPSSADAPETDWQILGHLVTALDASPLHGYTVCVQPTGAKPRGLMPTDHLAETDATGAFHFEGLDRRGPWDVFAFALDPSGAPRRLSPMARVGFTRAAPAGEAEVQTFTVRAGPLVILRSALPAEVETADLLFEARGRASLFSSQIGKLGGFARAFETPDGFHAGRIPHVSNSVRGDDFGIRAVTQDGLWSIAERREERLQNDTEATIDLPLQARGKVVLRLVADDPDVDLAAALQHVGWRLPLGDPERDHLDLPDSMATNERTRPLIDRGDGTYEIQDLPTGPIEIVTREGARTRAGEAAYEVSVAIQTHAVHGQPDPITVRMRRRR